MLRPLRSLAPFLLAVALVLSACSRPAPSGNEVPTAGISRRPPAADYSAWKNRYISLIGPVSKSDGFGLDLRHNDLSKRDLTGAADLLLAYATFDQATRWPASLPPGFDPGKILALGKEPGLGVRQLHREGITGKGVRVAFLDQTLLVDHEEFKDRIERYREIGNVPNDAQMHASAVLSILAGKSLGVAPEVSVAYYGVQNLDGGKFTWVHLAKAVTEILDENATLPPEEQIRVIGVSLGYSKDQPGYAEIKEAVARAKKLGVLVLTTAVETDYTFKFHGLGRAPLADPDTVTSYRPGIWWEDQFYQHPDAYQDRILVPMDSRATADPTATTAYVFYRQGGWSWVVPYLEGLYAMGLQVKPDLTPEEFYKTALRTGSYTTFEHDGKSYKLGPIVNPVALIHALQGK